MRKALAVLMAVVGLWFGQTLAAAEPASLQIGNAEAVVKLIKPGAQGTGVIVHPAGLILTIKHVAVFKPEYALLQDGRKLEVVNLWEDTAFDGAAYMEIKDVGEYPYSNISASVPPTGSPGYIIGFPSGSLSGTSGLFTGGMKFVQNREGQMASVDLNNPQGVLFNTIGVYVQPGYSGSPVFNDDDEVVGVVCAGHNSNPSAIVSTHRSVMAGYSEIVGKPVASANNAAEEGLVLPVLEVYTDPSWCLPCRRFEEAYTLNRAFRTALDQRLDVEKIDLSMPGSRQLADAAHVSALPTFIVKHHGSELARTEGFDGIPQFKAWLEEVERVNSPIAAPKPRGRGPGFRYLPKEPEAKPLPPKEEEGSGEAEPIDGGQEIDPTGLNIVILFEARELDGVKDVVLGFAPAQIQRHLQTVLGDKATVTVITERVAPDQFNMIRRITDTESGAAQCFVLIPKSNTGLTRGLVLRLMENLLDRKLTNLSGEHSMYVEPIFERIHGQIYRSVLDAASDAPKVTTIGTAKAMAKTYIWHAFGASITALLVSWVWTLVTWLRKRARRRIDQIAAAIEARRNGKDQTDVHNGVPPVVS